MYELRQVLTNEEAADLHLLLTEQRVKLAKVMARPVDTVAPDVPRQYNIAGKICNQLAAHAARIAIVSRSRPAA